MSYERTARTLHKRTKSTYTVKIYEEILINTTDKNILSTIVNSSTSNRTDRNKAHFPRLSNNTSNIAIARITEKQHVIMRTKGSAAILADSKKSDTVSKSFTKPFHEQLQITLNKCTYTSSSLFINDSRKIIIIISKSDKSTSAMVMILKKKTSHPIRPALG